MIGRYATRVWELIFDRGLKPAATRDQSLRDVPGMRVATGSVATGALREKGLRAAFETAKSTQSLFSVDQCNKEKRRTELAVAHC